MASRKRQSYPFSQKDVMAQFLILFRDIYSQIIFCHTRCHIYYVLKHTYTARIIYNADVLYDIGSQGEVSFL